MEKIDVELLENIGLCNDDIKIYNEFQKALGVVAKEDIERYLNNLSLFVRNLVNGNLNNPNIERLTNVYYDLVMKANAVRKVAYNPNVYANTGLKITGLATPTPFDEAVNG